MSDRFSVDPFHFWDASVLPAYLSWLVSQPYFIYWTISLSEYPCNHLEGSDKFHFERTWNLIWSLLGTQCRFMWWSAIIYSEAKWLTALNTVMKSLGHSDQYLQLVSFSLWYFLSLQMTKHVLHMCHFLTGLFPKFLSWCLWNVYIPLLSSQHDINIS